VAQTSNNKVILSGYLLKVACCYSVKLCVHATQAF